MVTGLYASLAASASIFIGILTALLTSNLSNLNTQREQIDRRIESINSELPHLTDQLEEVKDITEEKQDNLNKIEAVNHFQVYVHLRSDQYGLAVSEEQVAEDFADFLDQNELTEYQREAIDLEQVQFGPMDVSEEVWYQKLNSRRRHHADEQDQLHRNTQRRRELETQINSLQSELRELTNRYKSLDPSRLRRSVYTTVITIGLSVGVPLLAYLLRVSGVSFSQTLQPWIEPTFVFLIWSVGVLYVFKHLRDQVNEETEDIHGIALDE